MCVYVCIFVHIYIRMYIYKLFLFTHTCTYIYVCVYVYILIAYVYAYILITYVYRHKHINDVWTPGVYVYISFLLAASFAGDLNLLTSWTTFCPLSLHDLLPMVANILTHLPLTQLNQNRNREIHHQRTIFEHDRVDIRCFHRKLQILLAMLTVHFLLFCIHVWRIVRTSLDGICHPRAFFIERLSASNDIATPIIWRSDLPLF